MLTDTERAAINERLDLRAHVSHLEGRVRDMTRATTGEEVAALDAAHARADAVAGLFGERATQPLPGETPLAYRKRLLAKFQKHSPRLRNGRFDSLDGAVLEPMEEIVYADARAAAYDPARAKPGELVAIRERDQAGRLVTRFVGDPGVWLAPFLRGGQNARLNPGLLK